MIAVGNNFVRQSFAVGGRRRGHCGLGGTVEGVAGSDGGEAFGAASDVVGGKIEAEKAAVELFGDGEGGGAAAEGIEDDVVLVGANANDPAQELLGHLAAVKTGSLLERAGDSGVVPGVF